MIRAVLAEIALFRPFGNDGQDAHPPSLFKQNLAKTLHSLRSLGLVSRLSCCMKKLTVGLVAAVILGAASASYAGGFRLNVGVSVPLGSAPVYAPAPVCPPVVTVPAPVVYTPAPVVYTPVYAPATVYQCQPAVVYAPPPVVCAPRPVVCAPPVVVRPAPVVSFGFSYGSGHGHGHGYGYGYGRNYCR